MTRMNNNYPRARSRRQAMALLAAFGVASDALAQDAATSDPRAFRVVLENDRVRVLEFNSRPGLGVCGQGMHYHPARVSVSLTGGKVKRTSVDGKVTLGEVAPGHVVFAEAETHATEILGGAGTRMYIIELKGKDWKPSTG